MTELQQQIKKLQEDIERFKQDHVWLEKLDANSIGNDTLDGVVSEHIDRMREALRKQTKQLNALRLLILATQQLPLWPSDYCIEAYEVYREEYEMQHKQGANPVESHASLSPSIVKPGRKEH